ncbi:4-hydroxythreonine-4-phosphate dehydrogenase PdxA [Pacificimonas flava]|uniref:4-hydroxythreonine-4-phosphate dehydrogenase n=2 Tax=Pacificimonas TaxID=1960290 RepID=A0A219B8M9_9SPHN|nr:MULTISPECIES: 4-hydroxythreonine-4-phosphate dehydrogenase PdxA [Pacificimonas]MBZ6378557.1 4-hydroxythreonine-4-phosphate dehydrogenase PdxA [Pacificimonas aurantium]OWV34159.1 4-hydroxythreonine-4-phosphate dehydrogenase PdxA [Pacificimonas flava]
MIAPLAVALGDPAGVGAEVTAKAYAEAEARALPCFFAVGSRRALTTAWKGPVVSIETPSDAPRVFDDALPLIEVEHDEEIRFGEPSLEGARCALDSLEFATGLVKSGAAGALVTAPISKSQLHAIGFDHPGQTEFVAERCGVATSNIAMMLAGPELRCVPVTMHVGIARVPELLTADLVAARIRATARGLVRNFGITHPRIAVSGLNPHAGENQLMGDEEVRIIAPALEQLTGEPYDISGPWPADTLFHPRARAKYDAVVCMYHDQALIPVKTLHFDEGVNLTLGLPIVRTSPDHGTAFDIAGTGAARPDAMAAAIALADHCAQQRKLYDRDAE